MFIIIVPINIKIILPSRHHPGKAQAQGIIAVPKSEFQKATHRRGGPHVIFW